MKIAIFSDSFYPELGGIPDSVAGLAKELARMGHQINFYAARHPEKNYQAAGFSEKELKSELGNNIKINRFFSFQFRASTGQERLVIPSGFRWIKIRAWNPDVIHSQSFFGVGLEALITAKILKKPIIGTDHSAVAEYLQYGPFKADWFKIFAFKYVAWYYNSCNLATAPSKSVFEELKKYGFKKPHEVISNPIDIKIFSPLSIRSQKELKKTFGLSENTVVYAGRIAAEKNLDVIINAVALVKKMIPSVNLALAGRGSETENLKNLVKKLDLEKQVKFLGTLDKPALADLYRACDVFAISSTSETQSMVLMQAMACGLPAVGVRSRALPEYINNQNGFLVEPGDYKAFAEKLIILLENRSLREELGKNASNFVKEFSVPNIAGKWEMAYKRVIDDYLKLTN